MTSGSSGRSPDGLAEHGGDDALRRPLQQLAGEAAADAVAHVEELADAEMVHQPELVVGEGVPRVLGRHRAGGLAAIGVALVHRDAAEVVLELFHRVDHGGRPVADARVQAAAGGDQQREAGAGLLVADANVALLIERQGISLLLEASLAGYRFISISALLPLRETADAQSDAAAVLYRYSASEGAIISPRIATAFWPTNQLGRQIGPAE